MPLASPEVQSTLECLKLNISLPERSVTAHSHGLNMLVEHIELQNPQCHRCFRSDDKNIRFLRKAVLGCEYALVRIRHIVCHQYKFTTFVRVLHGALCFFNELTGARPPTFPPMPLSGFRSMQMYYYSSASVATAVTSATRFPIFPCHGGTTQDAVDVFHWELGFHYPLRHTLVLAWSTTNPRSRRPGETWNVSHALLIGNPVTAAIIAPSREMRNANSAMVNPTFTSSNTA